MCCVSATAAGRDDQTIALRLISCQFRQDEAIVVRVCAEGVAVYSMPYVRISFGPLSPTKIAYTRFQLLRTKIDHPAHVPETRYTLWQPDNGMQTLVPLATRVWLPSLDGI